MNNKEKRPSIESTKFNFSRLAFSIKQNIRSVKQGVLLSGLLSIVLGFIIWIFLRDISQIGLWFILVGLILLILLGLLAWRSMLFFLFGRRGRYGLNSSIIFLTSLGLIIVINSLLYWLVSQPNQPEWLRVDTTATKQFILEDQAIKVIANLKEDVKITVFIATNTPEKAAGWRSIEDLLLEFKRRSKKVDLSYERIDPELDPNSAVKYGVNYFPSLVIEAIDSRRSQIIKGRQGTTIFSEQDIITGLLIVSQIKQKKVIFLTGHGERDITDFDQNSKGMGLIYSDLMTQNYKVLSATSQELAILLSEENIPAVVVIAGAEKGFTIQDSAIISEYLWLGGSLLVLIEPELTPEGIKTFLYKFGLAVGEGTIFDMASFVAPKPSYLQLKKTNGQILPHEITKDFDVLYLPGSTYIGSAYSPDTIPITENGEPFVKHVPLAFTTLESWAQNTQENEPIKYNSESDALGPFPTIMLIEAISEIGKSPKEKPDGTLAQTAIVVIGDTDFASNKYSSSAKNADLFVNSINWLAKDYELITIRPKTAAFRELVLTKSERDFIRWSGWLLMPISVGIAGMVSWWRRR
ncbi:MAG: hypothetical protein CL715_02935 [Chloroflexi bacterium]|nr:hypothetical protein [Chloroflexota bacterium]